MNKTSYVYIKSLFANNRFKTVLTFLLILGMLSMLFPISEDNNTIETLNADIGTEDVESIELGAFPLVIPNIKWGFALDTFNIVEGTIENNQFFADVLMANEVDYNTVRTIVQNSEADFDVTQWRAGKKYTFLNRDTSSGPDFMVYEPTIYVYYVFDLKKDKKATKVKRPITFKSVASAGEIESSLWNAMVGSGMSFSLAGKMEDALQWSVDFHHLQVGDQFRLFYDQEYIDGEKVGVGKLHAAYFKSGINEHYAIYFDECENPGYYDLEGRPMNKGFLRSPVKYSRISSRFNKRRFHPILKRVKAHLGTDYAAPRGTPILAVGNGVVTEARFKRNNGNYVKIKHDKTYQTQYLHMSGFAKGISSGAQVTQGQVIGYVGSTGLATGPHVCFRFWKNGQQVNHLNLSFPPPEPLPDDKLPKFFPVRDEYLKALEGAKMSKIKKTENPVDSLENLDI